LSNGTMEIARHAAARTKSGKLVSVAGGGDTVAALNAAGAGHQFYLRFNSRRCVSRMDGGKALPGVEVLRQK